MPDLKNIAFDLDNEINLIGVSVNRLVDAEILLSQLLDGMEKAVHLGEEYVFYSEHHRMVRVLSYFIRNSAEELSKDFEKAEKAKTQLYEFMKQTDLNGVNDTPPGKVGVLNE